MQQVVIDKRRGYVIQCYFGNGKGKTTAAIGSVIRCVGGGQKAVFVGFLKDKDYAEFKVLGKIPGVDLMFSDEHYNLFDNKKAEFTPKFKKAYTELLFEKACKVIGSYQLMVLDEVLDALEFGYIAENDFINLLEECNGKTEIILTGHELTENVKKLCSYVSEVRGIVHPYAIGVASRKGIEY